jgi:hypothetical protein
MFEKQAIAVCHQAVTKLKLSDNRGFYYSIWEQRCNTGSKIKNGYTLYVIRGLSEIGTKKFME